MAVVTAYVDQVQKAYIAYYGRPADTTGLDYWTNQLSTVGGQWTSLINAFGNSAEATALLSGLTTEQKVNKLYQQLFGRDADVSGLTYYSVGIANGSFTLASVAINILNGASGTDVTTVANKLTSAKLFTNDLTTAAAITGYNSSTVADVRTWLAAVTTTAATQASADAAVSAVVNNGTINGTTYTLTTAPDVISGTANNDLVNGIVDFAGGTAPGTASTYNSADTIDGAGGTDTLSLILQNAAGGAITAFNAPTLKNVEVLNLRNISGQALYATGAGALDVSAMFPGVTTSVNSDRSTSAIFVKGLAAGTAVGMIGNGTLTNGNIEAAYAASATAATVNVSNGTTAGAIVITGAGNTSTTINSTGAANEIGGFTAAASSQALTINATTNLTTGAITSAGNKSITVTGGATTVTLGALAASTTTVDASAMTAGGVKLTAIAALTSLKGGQGNDTITSVGLTSTTAGIIDAGAGTGDKLIDGGNITTAAKGAQYVNFEVLQNTTTSMDASLVAGITSVEVNQTAAAGAGFTNLTAAQAAAVTNIGNAATANTLTLKDYSGSADVLSVTLKNSTATTSADLLAATVTGFETMNVVSSSGSSADINKVSFAAAANLTKLNLSGAMPIEVVTDNITPGVAVDASGVTFSPTSGNYALTLSGALAKGSVVTGTAAADSLTNGAAITGTTGDYVTFNAGAGNDLITAKLAGINNTSAAQASLKIDGGTGTDTLSADAGTYVDANFQYITNVEKLTFTGATALDLTAGGYFNDNFKATGVTISATAGKTYSIDATTFTGTMNVTTTETGGAVSDTVKIKTGTAADTVAVTTTKILTTTTSVINTNAGDDSVTMTIAAIDATGKITVNLGAGNDQLTATYAGAGLLDLTAGTGADLLAYGGGNHAAGKFTTNQGIGDSGTFVKPSANTISTTAFDVITGLKDNDLISLSSHVAGGTAFVTTPNTGNDISSATYANDTLTVIKGTYDSSAKTFVGSASGADGMLVYDSTYGAGITYEAVIVVGQPAVSSVANTGVITM